ncbi:hypothetical protein G9A89_017690 [Geosiphon pyriformis]|nr:hypothetical protein G9A89_017690 [Geosiphon pyriformis]
MGLLFDLTPQIITHNIWCSLIAYLLGTFINIELVRETFYNELIQNTSLLTNYNFASIITEINKEIKHYTQQRYPITYTSKDKEKLQTSAVTPQRIQPPTWKKTRVESPNNPSYHYTLGSVINILSTDMFTSNTKSAFGCFPFQKVEKEEESEDHKFTYQNSILENPESETPNFQTQPNLDNQENDTPNIQTPPNQNNPNPEVINQYLLPVIIIDQPPVEPIGQPIQPQNQQNQQPPPVPPQQQQQLLLLQQQQMAYVPITKLDKFNGEKDNAQDTANAWYQSFIVKLQNFNGFKTEFLWYFSNNNSINKLANTFTMIRQEDTEAVTTYLGHFHRNLCQIQAIQADYFTVPQILNQFIKELCSSILQQVRLIHPVDLSTTVTYTRDFETAKLEANYAQAVNLAMNGSSELDSKLKQFRKHKSFPKSVTSIVIIQSVMAAKDMHLPQLPIPIHLPAYDAPTNLSTTSLSTATTSNLLGAATSNISTTATSNLSNTHHSNTTSKPSSNNIRKPKIKDHPKLEINNGCTSTNLQLFPPTIRIFLLVTPENATSSNQGIEQQQPPTNNILPATITENESLNAIFPFELKELSNVPLFSRAALKEKLITAMYIDARIDGHSIKLILDSGYRIDHTVSARIITIDGATKTPIGKIDDFPIEVNDIIVFIKVLVIEATQY